MAWTEANINLLKREYGRVPAIELAARLRKTKNAVIGKAFRLGLEAPGFQYSVRRWSDEQLAFLAGNCAELTGREIAERIGRTETAVRLKAWALGLSLGSRA